MLDNMLDDIIKTSKSKPTIPMVDGFVPHTKRHTFTSDMTMLGSLLSDNIDRYGINAVQAYTEGYIRGVKLSVEAWENESQAMRYQEAKEIKQEIADGGDEPEDFSDERMAQDE